MNCRPPGFSAHGILQTIILEWVAISFFRASSQPGVEARSLALQAGSSPPEPPRKSQCMFRAVLISYCPVLCLEKALAPHSSALAWKIPWTEEPGRLQSMGSLRVGYNWATSLSLFTFMHWRRKWQPTPVFLPGESQGWGSLVGCRLWGHTESDMTEVT